MAQISVNNLTFYYDGSYDNVFEEASFQLDTTWKLGLVGRNGRGKTTLLKLLLGVYEYKGVISSPLMFEYFPYPVEHPEINTIDIIEEIDPEYELWKICRELNLLNVEGDVLYRPFSTLSNGEQTKVLLSILFAKESKFLLIDEPTNHLDYKTRTVIREYLSKKKGFILVSHDRAFLDGCVDHIMAINKKNIEIVQGNFSTWWENKKRRDQFELEEHEKLKKEVGRLTKAARQSSQWADTVETTKIGRDPVKQDKHNDLRAYIGEKSRRMQMRRKNLERRQERAIDEKKELLQNIEEEETLKILPLVHHKERLIQMEDVSVVFNKYPIFEHFGCSLSCGDRIALKGKNGCGKTSVLKILMGENVPYKGLIEIASGLIISYVSQDTSWLCGELKDFARRYGLSESLFKALLRKLDFSRIQFEKSIEDFSEGQKKKVLIAKSLCEQAHLYIWDEPLNFIDVFSRMQIEALILKYKPTMLLVEHDEIFIEKVATKIISFENK